MSCQGCGITFEPNPSRPSQRFCSRACQKKKRRRRVPGPCLGCGDRITRTIDYGPTLRYCSKRCRDLRNTYVRRSRKRGGMGQHSGADFRRLQARHDGLCAYCRERPGTERDHVIPVVRGGSDFIGNILPACPQCNRSKKDRLLVEWRQVRD